MGNLNKRLDRLEDSLSYEQRARNGEREFWAALEEDARHLLTLSREEQITNLKQRFEEAPPPPGDGYPETLREMQAWIIEAVDAQLCRKYNVPHDGRHVMGWLEHDGNSAKEKKVTFLTRLSHKTEAEAIERFQREHPGLRLGNVGGFTVRIPQCGESDEN